MILLWRPKSFMDPSQYAFWAHCWKTFAAKRGEHVVAAEWNENNVRRAWDTVEQIPGRYVIWAHPEFIPSVSMFSELDYLVDHKIRLVAQTRYNVGFAAGCEEPVLWHPCGVDKSLVVFQMTGQDKRRLPRGQRDIWDWLARERSWVYQVPQRFSGGHGRRAWASRSIMGETVYSPFTCPAPDLPITREGQVELWHRLLHAWSVWLNHEV